MEQRLANSSAGRVVLHLICLLRHPRAAGWHWRGIRREFQPVGALRRARPGS